MRQLLSENHLAFSQAPWLYSTAVLLVFQLRYCFTYVKILEVASGSGHCYFNPVMISYQGKNDNPPLNLETHTHIRVLTFSLPPTITCDPTAEANLHQSQGSGDQVIKINFVQMTYFLPPKQLYALQMSRQFLPGRPDFT